MYTINSREIKNKYPKLDAILDENNEKYKDLNTAKIKKSLKEEEILYVWKNDFCYSLNSQYDAQKAAEEWAEFYATKEFENVFLVFGLANGMYLRALLDRISDTAKVLVYEPDAVVFYKIINHIDCSELLKDKRVTVAGGSEQLPLVVEWLSFNISYMNYKKLRICILPNYVNLYETECSQFKEIILHQQNVAYCNAYTEVAYEKEFQENVLHNLADSVFQSTINQLREEFSKYDIKKIPAIIVSAGPSLDKNIKELKKAEGKAFIIAVDTALKAVLQEGIMPDLSVTVDPHKPEMLFEHSEIENIPFLYCKYSNWKLNEKLKGRRFYRGSGVDYMGGIHNCLKGHLIDDIDSGGSVAHEGFSLAIYLGFQKIILVGQDLAYPNGKAHTQAAYQGKEEDIRKKQNLLWVEDIYGNQVLTEVNMDIYRKWFEKQIIRRQSEICVIDATEGGAKIAGTKIMPLNQAIEMECSHSFDFKSIIEKIPPVYNEEEKEKIITSLYNVPAVVEQMAIEIKQGIEEYEELRKYSGENIQNEKKYRELIESIGNRNQWIETMGEMELVSMYNREEEYKIQENVYQQIHEKVEDEIEQIASDGIFMLNSYIKAIDCLKEQWRICIEELEKRNKIL